MDRAESSRIVAQEYDLPKEHQLMQWCASVMDKSDPESSDPEMDTFRFNM